MANTRSQLETWAPLTEQHVLALKLSLTVLWHDKQTQLVLFKKKRGIKCDILAFDRNHFYVYRSCWARLACIPGPRKSKKSCNMKKMCAIDTIGSSLQNDVTLFYTAIFPGG